MSMVGVHSVLPDSTLTVAAMMRKFQGHYPYQEMIDARGGRYGYGMAGFFDDALHHHFQGHYDYGEVYEERSGRYGYGMGHVAYGYELAQRRGRFNARGFAGLGQTCGDDGNCYDSDGNFIGTMDPSGTGPFNPVAGYVGPVPVITVAAGAPAPIGQGPSGPLYTAIPGATTVQAGGTIQTPSGGTVAVPQSTASQAQWANFWAQIAVAGIDITKLMVIQPGTSQAGGSITRQSPGYPVNPIATNTQTGITAKVSTGAAVAGSTVAIIGLGLVALMMMSSKRGGY